MSTTTTRIALVKETDAENYSIETVNANSDKVDAAVGFLDCTSGTRPSAPWNGQAIRETDTGSMFVSNGSAPASGSWLPIWGANGPVVVGAVGVNAPLRAETTSTLVNNRLIDARKQGEANPGFQLDFDGRMQWGPGAATLPDTWLYRSAAATLRTGGALVVDGAQTVSGAQTVTGAVTALSGSNRIGRPYLHAYQSNSGTHAVANITATPVAFNAEITDSINGHSTVTNNSRYTPTVAGKYRCFGQVVYAASGTHDFLAQFRRNGVVVLGAAPYGSTRAFASGFVAMVAQCGATIDMNGTTDYIELYTNQNSGGSVNTFSNTTDQHSYMIIEYVGP